MGENPPTSTGPDEATRKAEFNKWFEESFSTSISRILSDDSPSNPPAPTVQPPPASSGLTMKDVEDFMNRRDAARRANDDQSSLRKAVQELTDRFNARDKAERRRSWFGLPW